MVRHLACAVCALVLLCLGSSARAASDAGGGEDDLCVARDWLVAKAPMSLASAVPRLEAATGDREPTRACVSGAGAWGQCAIDGPAGSGSDPRPVFRDGLHSASLAAARRLAPPPARALPRTDASDDRLCPGFVRGIERPPRAP